MPFCYTTAGWEPVIFDATPRDGGEIFAAWRRVWASRGAVCVWIGAGRGGKTFRRLRWGLPYQPLLSFFARGRREFQHQRVSSDARNHRRRDSGNALSHIYLRVLSVSKGTQLSLVRFGIECRPLNSPKPRF